MPLSRSILVAGELLNRLLKNKGDLVTSDGSNPVTLPVGTDGQVLTADSSSPDGIVWADPTGGIEVIQNEGVDLPLEDTLNFVGAAVDVANDAVNNRNNVTFAATLNDIAGLTPAANTIITGNGTNYVSSPYFSPANEIFVAKNGNDTTGNGTQNNPYLTIQTALNLATSRTVVYVSPGIYTENLSFAGRDLVMLKGFGTADRAVVTVNGLITFDATSTDNIIDGITFTSTTFPTFDLNACGRVFIQHCQITSASAANTALNIQGAISGEIRIRSTYITGTVINNASTAFSLRIQGCDSPLMRITNSNAASNILVYDCPNTSLITHSAGIIGLRNIAVITAVGGICINSTANVAASNVLFVDNCNLQQTNLTYGTFQKTGTCVYTISDTNYNTADVLSGTRLQYQRFASQESADRTATNYTATNASVTGHLAGIDTALATKQPLDATLTAIAGFTYADGELLIGNTATGELSKATLTAGANVTITNGNGSITIAASGSGGGGDVTGPASSVDNTIVRFDGTTGKVIQGSGVVISDTDDITGIDDLTANTVTVGTLNGGTVNATINAQSIAGDNIVVSPYGTSAGNTGEVRFLELAASGTHYVAFKSPDALTASTTYILPTALPTVNGQVLTGNTDGTLYWSNAAPAIDTLAGLTDVAFGTLDNNDVFQALSNTIWTDQAPGAESEIQAYNVNISLTNVAETRAATINMADFQFLRPEIIDYSETTTTVAAAATTTLNLEDGNVFILTQDTNITTFVFQNPSPTDELCSFTLRRVKDNTGTTRSITWPASVRWAGATAPTLTQTANAVDVLEFWTIDNGTTWYGFATGLNVS